ncbi:MAG TPA: CDP-alcohol phosphatidyltransferase family protein [Pseudolabrys sp.]|nr:CDP-alcohol phosphatidyltransferase family protein [Pseudolabrys sp.]
MSSAAATAPVLVLLPDSDTAVQSLAGESEPRILGLGLGRRAALAAARVGYDKVIYLARDRTAPSGIAVVSDWSSIADAMAGEARPLIIANARILGEQEWLSALLGVDVAPGTWAIQSNAIILVAAASVRDALAELNAPERTYDLTAARDRLTRRFGPPSALPASIDPMVVTTTADIKGAEWRLLRALIKETDGFMSRHVERPISLRIARRLASTNVSPNQMTFLSAGVGMCAAPFFLSADWKWQTVGALLFLLHSILDGCDGELARLKFQESRFGGIIDYWGDNVVHIAVFACMAAGWSLAVSASWPLLLGAAASLGTLASASLVYWRTMRPKKDSGPLFTSVAADSGQKLGRMLDAATRRDFIYLVLIFALFGKSSWFLVLAAVGAPVFFFLLVLLSLRERLHAA